MSEEFYMKKVHEASEQYRTEFLSETYSRVTMILRDLLILASLESRNTIRELHGGPRSKDELLKTCNEKNLDELIKKNVVIEFSINDMLFDVLICDLKVVKFAPKYMIGNIIAQIKENQITKEMGQNHLGLLFDTSA